MMGEGGFKRKSKVSSDIPDSSLADMAFLLLIFFMVSTTFPMEKPRKLEFPEADATQKLDDNRKDILHVYLARNGNIFINDLLVPIEGVAPMVADHYPRTQQRLVTVLKADRDVPYHFVDAIQDQLSRAGAVRLTFYTNLQQRVRRERR
jgi:biopolymer transport protein ExbD